ncbi:MAG TPA: hypothetical protein VGN12_09375 [Pirellulales bacterium]|jgi:hypothetical protein
MRNRHWFRFLLATTFIVSITIALFAVLLVSEWYTVRDRGPMLKRIAEHGEIELPPDWEGNMHYRPNCEWTEIQEGTKRLPVFWGHLGAEPIESIYVDSDAFSQAEISTMCNLFPEASITAWHDLPTPEAGNIRLRRP